MAVVQDTYNAKPADYFEGQIYNGETSNRVSRTIVDADGVGFGKACFESAVDQAVTKTPAADTFVGVTFIDHALSIVPGGVADTWPQGRTLQLVDKGVMAVRFDAAAAKRSPVFVTAAGLFTTTAGGNTAIPATVYRAIAAAGVTLIRIDRRQ